MRISDWSSDVCSSDLPGLDRIGFPRAAAAQFGVEFGLLDDDALDVVVPFDRDRHGKEIEVDRNRLGDRIGGKASQVGDRLAHAGFEHRVARSEEHTSELQSLMLTSYPSFCLKK